MSTTPEDRWNHHDSSFWEKNHNLIRTKLGGVVEYPKIVCCGYDLFNDLVGEVSWVEMLHIFFKKKRPEKAVTKVLDAICVCGSYPDPRIWCHRAGRHATAMKSLPGSALAAAICAFEGKTFGGQSVAGYMQYMLDLQATIESTNSSLEEVIADHLRQKRLILGFGRPIVKSDERIPFLFDVIKTCGLGEGTYVRLGFEVERILKREKDIRMNYSGIVGAVLLDLDFTPLEGHLWLNAIAVLSLIAVVKEGEEKAPGDFLPMKCSDIDYQGAEERTLAKHII